MTLNLNHKEAEQLLQDAQTGLLTMNQLTSRLELPPDATDEQVRVALHGLEMWLESTQPRTPTTSADAPPLLAPGTTDPGERRYVPPGNVANGNEPPVLGMPSTAPAGAPPVEPYAQHRLPEPHAVPPGEAAPAGTPQLSKPNW